MIAKDTTPTGANTGSRERWVVLFLCALAAVHVFVYSAAFPFFGPVDEIYHFDLMVKYSQAGIPPNLKPLSEQSMPHILPNFSLEYSCKPEDLPDGKYPQPLRTQPEGGDEEFVRTFASVFSTFRNHEAMQPPLYYFITAACWKVTRALQVDGPGLLFGIRFLNMLFVAMVVWLGHVAARILFPERRFVRLGVPAMLAFLPQRAFYAIENDVLSPLCFGAVFVCLVRWLSTDKLSFRLAVGTGLALAATVLAKLSNLPLLAVATTAIVFQAWKMAREGALRTAWPALALLAACASLPPAAWLMWNKIHFGYYTAAAGSIQSLDFTYKPFNEWWHHPIFTPAGFWTFISELIGTFWQGEMTWHGQSLVPTGLNILYTILTVGLAGTALAGLLSRSSTLNQVQRRSLWLSLACLLAALVFLAFLSIIYDFHECRLPSRAHPYFACGRLALGAAIPFMIVLLVGLDFAFSKTTVRWVGNLVLPALIGLMLIAEAITNWPVFFSQYNWYHL